MTKPHRALSACATTAVLLLPGAAAGEDWPQFLGPRRDGTSREESLIEGWLRDGLVQRWSVALGSGYSGIVTQGEALFTMDSRGAEEFVVSLSTVDGRERWRVRTGSSPQGLYGGLGPRVTPSVDGQRLFTVSAAGRAMALHAATGAVVWERDLAREFGWRPPAEGASASPLVADGRVYLMNGGAGRTAVALDRETGEPLWSSIDDRVSYASPLRWQGGGVDQVLFLAGAALFSLDPANGRELWSYPWPTYDDVNVATPLPAGRDEVFLSSGYDQGAAALRVWSSGEGGLEVREIWRNREMKNHFNNSVYFERTYYGFDNSILKAVDAESGESLWADRGFGKGSLVRAGRYLVVLSDGGELACGRARRDRFEVEARLSPIEGRTWTPPTLAGGSIYLRGPREVVRLSPPMEPGASSGG